MAYVITEGCTKDEKCVEACPVDCVHPMKDEAAFETAEMLHIDPENCIDCGACVPVCPAGVIYPLDEVPENQKAYIERNAAYYTAAH
jgi:ferredoxin